MEKKGSHGGGEEEEVKNTILTILRKLQKMLHQYGPKCLGKLPSLTQKNGNMHLKRFALKSFYQKE